MSMHKVLLADAQFLIRQGLRTLIERESNATVSAEVTNEEELFRHLESYREQVDLLIIDYKQPNFFSSRTVSRVKQRFPQLPVLIISADEDKRDIYRVLEEGTQSFLTKHCDASEIVEAMEATIRGEKFFCKKVLDYILEKSFGKAEDCSPSMLTPREAEIVRLIANGMVAKQIASELNLSTHTIYTHRKNIMRKLELGSSSELVRFAVDHGLVD